MTEDRYHLTAKGTVTEDMMRRALVAAHPHMNALSAEVLAACPDAPPGVMAVTLLAVYLSRALADSDDFAAVINAALDNTGAHYRLQRRGH